MSTGKLLTSNESYRILVEGIVDYSIYLLELDGTIASWNAGASRLKGYTPDEIIGRNFATLYTPDDIANGEPQRALSIAAATGKFEGEGWRQRKDGSRFRASVVIDALRDETGRLIGFAKVTRDITERALREQQRQVIVDTAPNGMVVLDPLGAIAYANPQAERILGASTEDLRGRRFDAVLTRTQCIRAGGSDDTLPPFDFQTIGGATKLRADGTTVQLDITFNEVPTASGRVIVASIVDITERLRLEAERLRSEIALRETNRLMTMAEEMAHYGHWRHDLRTGQMFWSDEVYRSHGLPRTYQPTANETLAAYDPDDVSVREIMARAMTAGAPFSFESRVKRTDGTFRDVRVSGRGEFDAGSLVAIVGIHQDITDLKTAERERDRLVERITLATAAANVGIWEWDIVRDVALWDQRMFALYGLSADAKVGSLQAAFDFVHPDDRERIKNDLQAALEAKAPLDMEYRIVWPGGETRTVQARGTVVRDSHGMPVRMVGTVWDVTEVRSLTQQLREERERQLAYEREQRYEHERKWSTTFQRAVLPLSLPQVAGCDFDAVYEPGLGDAQVGGDWYDAVRLIDGRVLVSIGDVAGNGLEAAVVVGVVRQIMRGIAQLHANPMLILDAADRALSLEYPGVYVTAWIGIIDLVTATITYASAGHPPPLIVTRDGMLRELEGTTLPIGLREGRQGVASSVAIADGDTLVLYTDGVTEATRDPIEGAQRLALAAARAGAERPLHPAQRIKQQVIPGGSRDDVAILVVRIDLTEAERHIARIRFDAADGRAASAARQRFAGLLSARGFSLDDIANAELVFGELIGNVVQHAGPRGSVDVAIDFGSARTVLHVMDRGGGFRHISRLPPDPYCEHGRGLFLIAAMTAEFTVAERRGGGSHARAVLLDQTSPSLLSPQALPVLGDLELDLARDEPRPPLALTPDAERLTVELQQALAELEHVGAEIRSASTPVEPTTALTLANAIERQAAIVQRLAAFADAYRPAAGATSVELR